MEVVGELSVGVGGTFGRLTPFNTATSQELLGRTHPKAHDLKEEWEGGTIGGGFVGNALSTPRFVCKEFIQKGGGGRGVVPQRGRLFKFGFPLDKFWVNIFWGSGGSQNQKTPPPLINKAGATTRCLSACRCVSSGRSSHS